MTDLIVGAAANYRWETSTDCTYPFVVSMRRSGYKGRCVFIVSAPISPETKKKYDEYGIELWNITPKDQYDYPHVFRFRAIPEIIRSIPDLRYVLALDVKDIVFQSDPTKWLEENLGEHKIVGFSYEILHKDSAHARNLFIHIFGPEVYESVANRNVYGVGIVCGLPKEISELSQAISDLCDRRLDPYIENSYCVPDQQAYNLLLSREPWLSSIKTLGLHNGFISLGEGTFNSANGTLYPLASPSTPCVMYHHNGYPEREVIIREKYKG